MSQLARRTGRIDDVPQGVVPVVHTPLNADQYIVSAKLVKDKLERAGRAEECNDWTWSLFIVTP